MELKVFLRESVQNGEGMCANHSVFSVSINLLISVLWHRVRAMLWMLGQGQAPTKECEEAVGRQCCARRKHNQPINVRHYVLSTTANKSGNKKHTLLQPSVLSKKKLHLLRSLRLRANEACQDSLCGLKGLIAKVPHPSSSIGDCPL